MEIIYVLAGAALVVGASLLVASRWSFKSQKPQDYATKGPQFDIRQHLQGPILCEGVIYGPTGRVTSRFVADFDAHWEGNTGVMKETFRYDSGEVQDREWRLTLGNDGSIKADADDLVGQGSGRQEGNAVQLNYNIRLPEKSGGHVLSTTDWMYLVENGTIMNRSQFRKFGIKVAELVATMRPKES
ncbi:MAG: DUF3833 domain-containing protein [Pseudomonadota bacterium]